DLQLSVRGDGNVMLGALGTGTQAHVAAGLTSNAVAIFAKRPRKLLSAEVTRKFQAGMTSSLTRCRRITCGFVSSAKWHDTASRSIVFSSSIESAWVNIGCPNARAS